MASRPGQLYLPLLVVALVISLGLIVLAALQNSEITRLKDDLARAETEKRNKDTQFREAVKERNSARKLLLNDEEQIPDYEKMTQWVASFGDEFAKVQSDKPDGEALKHASLSDVMSDCLQAIAHWRQQYALQKTQAEVKEQDYIEKVAEKEGTDKQRDDEIAQLNQKINDLQVESERTRTDAVAREEEVREEFEEREDELTAKISLLERNLHVETNLHNRTKRRVAFLENEIRKEQTFDRVDPDGEIVDVSDELGFAWIDLGQNHRLRQGTVFDVFQFVKGAKRLKKGKVEVVSMDAVMAKVAVTELVDDLNPILPGDKVASPFYSPTDQPVFVFAGDKLANQRLSLEEIQRKIDNFGGKVEDAVRIETSYVVAIHGYENSPEYKTARELGITILRETELLSFIGF